MGQKIHPHGFRLGVIRTWESRWFAKKGYSELLVEDAKVRELVKKRLFHAAVSKIDIERSSGKLTVNIFSARPGIIIGKKGAEVDTLRKDLKDLTQKEVFINIREVRNAEIDPQLIAENIAGQLERRVGFRRAMKKAITTATAMGAKGIRSSARAAWAGPKSPASKNTWKARCRFTPFAPTSNTAARQPTPPTAPTASRSGFSPRRSWTALRCR
jgi:small subunit ribosomal protein S3